MGIKTANVIIVSQTEFDAHLSRYKCRERPLRAIIYDILLNVANTDNNCSIRVFKPSGIKFPKIIIAIVDVRGISIKRSRRVIAQSYCLLLLDSTITIQSIIKRNTIAHSGGSDYRTAIGRILGIYHRSAADSSTTNFSSK